jgi:hypothetical protein
MWRQLSAMRRSAFWFGKRFHEAEEIWSFEKKENPKQRGLYDCIILKESECSRVKPWKGRNC